MAEPVPPQATQPTVMGLIAKHGLTSTPSVRDLVQLGAAAQREQLGLDVSDTSALTRSTALWIILNLDADIAENLEANRITRVDLGRALSLTQIPAPLLVNDVAVQPELGRALDAAFADVHRPEPIDLVDIAVAILYDAAANGGLLARRLGDAGTDVAGALKGLAGLKSPAPSSSAEPRRRIPLRASRWATSGPVDLYLRSYEALRARATTGVADVGSAGDQALWQAFGLVASFRGGTVATVVALTVLGLRGEKASIGDRHVGLRAFDLPDESAPLAPEGIDLDGHPLLGLAAVVRDRVEPGEVIRLRHLVGVALDSGSGPLGPATRDRDIAAVRTAFLDDIRREAPPEITDRWNDYFADAAAASEPPAPVRRGRAVAGVAVDLVDDSTELSDELGVVDDVVTLCDMVASRGAVPPISVGLFGRWGSGKSYFMALMRRRIDELRNAAVAARERGEATSYCSEIVQVTFNAWHYMDADDLWATLAVHLFSAIAQVDPDDDRARPRADVVRELQERERRMETVDRRITRALGDHRLDEAAERMGLTTTREDMLGLLGEIDTARGYVAAAKVLLTRGRRWLVVVLVATLAVLLGLTGLMASGALPIAWLVVWAPLALSIGKWLRVVRSGLAEVNRVAAESGLQPHDLTAERIANDAQILALLDELKAIDQLTSNRDWVRERALSTDYTSHFGVISVLRGDLEALVEKQRRDSPDRRIILYIDDLDRCEPSRVVEVLQAVHLLLAFPLFVAVVGVDPRWLLRSLERHYRQVLSTADGGGARVVDDLLSESTPHDYLEKIFQIPFALRPMGPEGYGRLVASLTGSPAGEAIPTTPEVSGPAAADPTGIAAADGAGREAPTVQARDPVRGPASAPAPEPPSGVGARAGAGTGTDELAPVAVNPPQLRVTEAEVAALAQMGPLIGTPRAAKRLVNLYRLVRAGLGDHDVERFVADAQYRSLAIVLAMQVGWARVATAFLSELVDGAGDLTITERLDALPRPGPDRPDRASLITALRAVCADADGRPVADRDRPLAELRSWLPRLRRYSFEGALGPS